MSENVHFSNSLYVFKIVFEWTLPFLKPRGFISGNKVHVMTHIKKHLSECLILSYRVQNVLIFLQKYSDIVQTPIISRTKSDFNNLSINLQLTKCSFRKHNPYCDSLTHLSPPFDVFWSHICDRTTIPSNWGMY